MLRVRCVANGSAKHCKGRSKQEQAVSTNAGWEKNVQDYSFPLLKIDVDLMNGFDEPEAAFDQQLLNLSCELER